ncbi:MAG: flagellar biosynthesis anti-sigma factor FlgM [Planctomycetota bacterium]
MAVDQLRRPSRAHPAPSLTSADAVDPASRGVRGHCRGVEPIRLDRVLAIREAISEGTYDTDWRLDAALDAVLRELGG